MGKIFKVGLVGCGHIAETYFRAHKYFNNFKIIKCADINKFAAQRCAKTYKISSVSVNELLKDKEIQVVLNLTILLVISKIIASHSPSLLNKEKTSSFFTLITLVK